jgi:ComF family protein
LHPPPLDRTLAALDYAFPWDGLLQRFKFQQAIELRGVLAARLRPLIDEDLPDLLLPVPITAQRLRERGYNQSHLLARYLARDLARPWRLPCPDNLLLKVRDGEHQARLPLAERADNVRGVFAVEPRRLTELKGRHVAIVDDVMTSGTTLYEIARVLRAAGATRVQAWVIARTPE